MSDATGWLADWVSSNRRPLRVLHIGNIANNAYINAKLQRARGIEADVACYDYYHVMGAPEWEDADFAGDVGSEAFPDWRRVDLKGYRRPDWFAQGRMETCRRYLLARRTGHRVLARKLHARLRLEGWLACRTTAVARVARRVLPAARRARGLARGVGRMRRAPAANAPVSTSGQDAWMAYVAAADRWKSLLQEYDIVQAYALDPAIPFAAGVTFAAYEHGTIREIPFEDSERGRLAARSYLGAAVVFVTNADNLDAAHRLGIEDERIVALPHAVDSTRLRSFAAAHSRLRPPTDHLRVFAPARQDWVDGDPSWTKGNDRFFRGCRHCPQRVPNPSHRGRMGSRSARDAHASR